MSARRRRAPGTSFLLSAIGIGFAVEVLTGAWLNGEKLARLGAIVRPWILEGEYWRLLTAMFLHGDGTVLGDILHLSLNLFSLFQVGTLYELMFGTRRFVVIYFVAGIMASITSAIFSGGPSVGASGAIFGIVGAFFFSVLRSPRWRHESAARGIIKQLLFWTVANIVLALQVPQIDNAAHIGGLLTGLLLGAVWPHRVPPPSPAQVTIEVTPYEESAAGRPEQRNGR